MALVWDATKRRYRDDATGRLVTRPQLRQLRDELADAYSAQFRTLTQQYGEGAISRTAWESGFRDLITRAAADGYAFGRGGVAQMTDTDFDALLRIVTTQLQFGEGFFTDVRAQLAARQGQLARDLKAQLLPQLTARADLYGGAAVHGFEQGQAVAVTEGGLANLPAYPADGSSECGANDRCAWVITEQDGMWAARWVTERDGNVCPTCQWRGDNWNPLMIPMGSG